MYKPGQFVNIGGTTCRAAKSNAPCIDCKNNNCAVFTKCMVLPLFAAAEECQSKLGSTMYPAPIYNLNRHR